MRLKRPCYERLAQLVAAGEKGARAYRKVYGNHIVGARQLASRLLLTRVDIQERVMELQQKAENESVLTAIRRREIMREIAENSEEKAADRISATMADAKLAGDLTEKTETTHLGDPNAPLVVELPSIITKPRPRRQAQETPPKEEP